MSLHQILNIINSIWNQFWGWLLTAGFGVLFVIWRRISDRKRKEWQEALDDLKFNYAKVDGYNFENEMAEIRSMSTKQFLGKAEQRLKDFNYLLEKGKRGSASKSVENLKNAFNKFQKISKNFLYRISI